MFLKTEPFEHNGMTVTLYELSALQRIEHLEHLKSLESIEDSDMQKAMSMTITTGALIVAMSLWHGHELKGMSETPKTDVARIQAEVMNNWPLEAISAAEYRVKSLSGMIQPVSDDTSDVDAPAETVSAEKSLPVS